MGGFTRKDTRVLEILTIYSRFIMNEILKIFVKQRVPSNKKAELLLLKVYL